MGLDNTIGGAPRYKHAKKKNQILVPGDMMAVFTDTPSNEDVKKLFHLFHYPRLLSMKSYYRAIFSIVSCLTTSSSYEES